MGELKHVLVAVYFFCNYIYAKENGEPCGQQELVSCSKQIKALTATSEFNFIIDKKELENLCPDLHLGLECIRSYTRRCMSLQQRSHFNKLYYGTNEMISELCKEGAFQEAYLRHAPCMKKVKAEYDVCAQNYKQIMQRLQSAGASNGGGVPQTTTAMTTIAATTMPRFMQINSMKRQQELNSVYVSLETTTKLPLKKNSTDAVADHGEHQIEQTICCAFKKYIECSENVIREACGPESAEFTRVFLDKMLSSLMRMHCEKENHHCEEFASLNGGMRVELCLMLIITIVVITFAT